MCLSLFRLISNLWEEKQKERKVSGSEDILRTVVSLDVDPQKEMVTD